GGPGRVLRGRAHGPVLGCCGPRRADPGAARWRRRRPGCRRSPGLGPAGGWCRSPGGGRCRRRHGPEEPRYGMSPDRGAAGRSPEAGASRRRDGALLAAAVLTALLTGCSLDTGALGENIASAWEGADPPAGAEALPPAGTSGPTSDVEAA